MTSPLFGAVIPPLRGEHGHDLAENPRFPTWPCRFDPMLAYAPLVRARRLGLGATRWLLCEGGEGIRLDAAGAIDGVSERLLESVKIVEEAARLQGLYLYWTLLDADTIADQQDSLTRSIVAEPAVAQRFAERVVAPLARALDPVLTLGLDALSAPELAAREVGWASVGAALRAIGDAARGERELLVTAGTAPSALPELLGSDPRLDALDLRIVDGQVPDEAALARLAPGTRASELPRVVGHLDARDEAALLTGIDALGPAGYAAAFVPEGWLGGEVATRLGAR